MNVGHDKTKENQNLMTVEDAITVGEKEEEVFRRRELLAKTPPPKAERNRSNSLSSIFQVDKLLKNESVKRKNRDYEDEDSDATQMRRIIERINNTSKELYKLTEKNITTKVEIKLKAKNLYWQIEELCRSWDTVSGKSYLNWKGKSETSEIGIQTCNLENNRKATDSRVQTKSREIGTQTCSFENEDSLRSIYNATQESSEYKDIAKILDAQWPEHIYQKTVHVTNQQGTLRTEGNYAMLIDPKGKLDSNIRSVRNRFQAFDDLVANTNGEVEYLVQSTQTKSSKGETIETSSAIYMIPVTIDENGVNDMEEIHLKLGKLAEAVNSLNLSKSINLIIGHGLNPIYVRKLCEQVFAKQEVEIKLHSTSRVNNKRRKNRTPTPTRQITQRTREENETTALPTAKNKNEKDAKKHTEVNSRKKPKKKSEAIIVQTNEGSYAEVLKKIRSKIDPDTYGVTLKGVRKTKAGEILLEVAKNSRQLNELKTALESAAGASNKVKILNDDNKKAVLIIKDIEDSITKEEVLQSVRKSIAAEETDVIELTSLRPAYSNMQIAIITTTERIAKKILNLESSRIRIGWVACRIRRWVPVTQCYKCFKYGHTSHECTGEDLSSRCIKCGQEGHKKTECENQPKCLCCGATGHSSGTGGCKEHRKALEEARKLQHSSLSK